MEENSNDLLLPMKYMLLLSLLLLLLSCETEKEDKTASFPTVFEESDSTESATYQQVIDFYIQLAREFPEINIQTLGGTDSGYPLHVVTYNPGSDFNFQKINQNNLVLLIDNGIHPGEPDGIDATMLLYRDMALGRIRPPKHVVLVTIPVYNVGGALNRNSTTRVNQNGPKAYGFRGNARNYDLNRDFIKMDTRNARTFAQIFHTVKPDVFVDTHVSNGADYQYTLTHLFTQADKLGEPLGNFLKMEFLPELEDSLATKDWDITPYVNVHDRPPDNGFTQFWDSPRYSTGYAALWNTLGVMVETHMLKPYKERVRATYDFLYSMVQVADVHFKKIKETRAATDTVFRQKQYYPLSWAVDSTTVTPLEFKGYEADTLKSDLTGQPLLKYHRDHPYTKTIPYWDHFRATDSIEIPEAYIVKKSWGDIIQHLELNGIQYSSFEKDTTYWVTSYHIKDYRTTEYAYEGHYPHYGTSVERRRDSLPVREGDFLIPTDQPGIRYLLETLEPAAEDSFFNWNFFDPILQQKEGFSSYVFEELADSLLAKNTGLKRVFESRKASDPDFAKDAQAQLEWIYKRSPYYEKAHLQYPVYRIPKMSEAEDKP